MNSISKYQQTLSRLGVTDRDRYVEKTKRWITTLAPKNTSTKTVTVNDQYTQQIIIRNSTTASEERNVKYFQTMPGEIVRLGDILAWGGMHWVVIQLDFDSEVTMNGILYQCNKIVRWQNPETYELHSRYANFAIKSTIDLRENQEIVTSKQKYQIYIGADEETLKLDLDKRFLLDEGGSVPRAYKITYDNPVTLSYEDVEGGCLVWTLMRDEFNRDTDNAELMIADYIEDTNQTYIKYETLNLRAGGMEKKFTYSIPNRPFLTKDEVRWEVLYSDQRLEPFVHVKESADGKSISLQADLKARYGDIITLNLYVDDELFDSVNVKVVGLY